MSQEIPIILYVGPSDTARWLDLMLSPWGGYVYARNELLTALGVYVNYVPDVVILDAWAMPNLARQTYLQLRSVNAEQILVLDGNVEDWEPPADTQIHVLTSASRSDLLSAIGKLIGPPLSSAHQRNSDPSLKQIGDGTQHLAWVGNN